MGFRAIIINFTVLACAACSSGLGGGASSASSVMTYMAPCPAGGATVSCTGGTSLMTIADTTPTCASLGIVSGTPCTTHFANCLVTAGVQCTITTASGPATVVQPASYMTCLTLQDKWTCPQ